MKLHFPNLGKVGRCFFQALEKTTFALSKPWKTALLAAIFLALPAFAVENPKLSVVKVDSAEKDSKGANAVDGNPDTLWHTQWQQASPAHPHWIIIKLNPPC